MTTTIRIEDDLKTRVSAAAERSGQTAHAFMLGAIAATVEAVEADAAFQQLAQDRWAGLQATGKTVPWGAAKTYLEARARGDRAKKPTAVTPRAPKATKP
jgi:predicted transcriptional regulator